MMRPVLDIRGGESGHWALRRKQRDSKGGAAADSLGSNASEFERFEDLTRKLVQVPKSEIDEKCKGKP